jgi:hypothetical protein
MKRFFVGLGLGTVLTIYSFGFVGAGHGTAVPLVFTTFFIALIPQLTGLLTIVMGPFLWSLYFLFIPKLQSRRSRLITITLVLALHLSTGSWLAIQDPAFPQSVRQDRSALAGFALVVLRRKSPVVNS